MSEYIEKNGYLIELRQAKLEDISKIGEMSYSHVFPEILEGESLEEETDRWRGRYETFPQGLFVAEDKKLNRIIGATATQIINWNYSKHVPSWTELTDNGTIHKTHTPNGNTLHLVSIHVDREYTAGLGIGSALVQYQTKLFMESPQLDYMIVGHTLGRATAKEYEYFKGFLGRSIEQHAVRLNEYLNLKNERGEPIDSLMRFYYRTGFRFAKLVENFEEYPEYNYSILEAIKK